MQFLIDKRLLEQLLSYLATKPFSEVNNLISLLASLPEMSPEESDDKTNEKSGEKK